MSDTLQLIHEAMEVTDAAPPALLEDDSPALADDVLAAPPGELYLVGLIGGKDVGKSALVNALVGRRITPPSSHGAGTETAIAYCHESRQAAVRELLEKQVPGRYSIVPHNVTRLTHQVLLDLPDIDSHFAEHVEVTRKMLRHMLFPIWVQSVEKYADAQPQKLLARVAAGNDPKNFVFCLNKVDQLFGASRDRFAPPAALAGDAATAGTTPATATGLSAGAAITLSATATSATSPTGAPAVFPPEALELRDDYAGRLAKLLSLPAPPRVYLIAAVKPDQFDLPALAAAMSQEKTTTVVKESRRLAGRRREASMLAWLDAQDLPGRAKRLGRLLDDAQELSAQRLGVPIVESSIPAIVADPAYRLMMTDGVLSARVARWPLVSLVHTLLAPLNYVVRENVAGGDLPGARGIVDGHLRGQSTGAAELVQTTFAQLHQTQPLIAELYRNRRLWEPMHASAAAADLRTMLADTTERQRASIMTRLAGRRGLISPLIRWLLTIGAALWFPIGQPVLEAMLEPTRARTARDVGLIAVHILGVTPLLESAAFLMIYFLALWAWIKWDTNRRVSGLLSRWKTGDHPDPSLNFTTQTLQWVDGLLEPIRVQHQRLESLAGRMTDLRKTLADGKTAETEAA